MELEKQDYSQGLVRGIVAALPDFDRTLFIRPIENSKDVTTELFDHGEENLTKRILDHYDLSCK